MGEDVVVDNFMMSEGSDLVGSTNPLDALVVINDLYAQFEWWGGLLKV